MLDKWDLRFLKIAREVSGWSKDPNRKVGAVVVKNRRILSTGYNGYPIGYPDTNLNRKDKNLYTVHAEANAIASAKSSLKGSTIYVAGLHPCAQCAALIVQSGVKRVIYDFEPSQCSAWTDSVSAAKSIFKQCHIKTECALPTIVLVGGKKHSGKSWVSKHLGLPVRAFADIPKQMFFNIFGENFDDVKTDVTSRFNNLTARKFMQRFATDACQAALGPTIWRDLTIESLQELKAKGYSVVVISDWRFKHEVIPGALKVYIQGGVTSDHHISENDIGPEDADIVLDNTSKQLTNESLADLRDRIVIISNR